MAVAGFLMPATDVPDITLVGAQSGHSRPTRSWVLGRLFRDAHHRATAATRTPGRAANKADETWDALRVSVYRFDEEPRVAHGVPKVDLVWCTGFVVIAVQTVLSILPWILHGDWTPFLIAAVGNVLALVGASMPQWRAEKWACPKDGGRTVTLTQGNGSRFAMVILGSKKAGLNLEALATAVDTSHPSILTRATSGVLALCWLALLVTVAGVQEHTWCRLLSIYQNFTKRRKSRNWLMTEPYWMRRSTSNWLNWQHSELIRRGLDPKPRRHGHPTRRSRSLSRKKGHRCSQRRRKSIPSGRHLARRPLLPGLTTSGRGQGV